MIERRILYSITGLRESLWRQFGYVEDGGEFLGNGQVCVGVEARRTRFGIRQPLLGHTNRRGLPKQLLLSFSVSF